MEKKVSLKKAAKKYLEAGFNVIPTRANKLPAVPNWTKYQKKLMCATEFEDYFTEETNVGVLTGGKTRVVCFDADMKYDLSGDLWERFLAALPEGLLGKMMMQKTKNGGYHLVFKAPESRLFGNEKLAGRPTTAYEKHQTYVEYFSDPDTMDIALKTALNDSSRILFETRSGDKEKCGGYFLIFPSKGYEYVQGKIGELTEDEYDALMQTARSFNQVKSLEQVVDRGSRNQDWEVSPFEHYNSDGDVLELLEESGWRVLNRNGRNIRLVRPGQTHATSSAMFDNESRTFNCFSTSTPFDVGKGYSPSSVFVVLEAEKDMNLAYNKLVSLGYGLPKNA
jgi:hypothetical protein